METKRGAEWLTPKEMGAFIGDFCLNDAQESPSRLMTWKSDVRAGDMSQSVAVNGARFRSLKRLLWLHEARSRLTTSRSWWPAD